MIDENAIYNADCFDVMQYIKDKSIDLILCDLPYRTTACKWDTILPLKELWKEYERIITDKGAIVLFCAQPFTTTLINSNIELFKYCWVWEKTRPFDIMNSKNKPLKAHEDIAVFSKGTVANKSERRMNYYPQGLIKVDKKWSRPKKYDTEHGTKRDSHKLERVLEFENYPRTVLKFANPNNNKHHPTEKPISILEYLIKTYTEEGMSVLDNCMGSGSTCVAAKQTNRTYIGIEKEERYFKIASNRINEMLL